MKNNGTDVLWLIEHIARELDVACAVAYLVKKDFKRRIYIHPLSYLKKCRTLPIPRLVILPYFYSLADSGFTDMVRCWPRACYFNVSWEQVFYRANMEYKAPKDEFARRFVYHHAWSHEREAFLLGKKIPKKHIFTNGHPAYALYRTPYKKAFVTKNELARHYGIDPEKRWIFFPENFSWFFYSEHQLEQIIKNGQDKNVAYRMRDYCRDAFKHILKWLDAISPHSGVEIILRPRPAFSLAYFSQKLEEQTPGLSNKIIITKDYSVREWIMASDVTVSTFSTSLIEAAIAEKPILMLQPEKIPDSLSAPWYGFVEKIRTQLEFAEVCSGGRLGSFTALHAWALKQFFVHKDPIQGLSRFIGSFDVTKRVAGQNEFIQDHNTRSRLADYVLRTQTVLGALKRKVYGKREYYRNDDENTYYREIEKRYKLFSKLL